MSDNVIFMADNMVDRGTVTASSEVATMPATNLQNQQRTRVWRSDGSQGGVVSLDITLAAGEENVSGIAVVDHNLSLAGTIRIQGWTDALDGAAQVVDETLLSYAPVAAFGDGLFGDGLFGGYEPIGPLVSYSPRNYLRVITFLQLTAETPAKYWRITLADSSVSYFQLGRVFIGKAWQPVTNFSWGARLYREATSKSRESRGGQHYINPRPGRMVMEFDLDWLQGNDKQKLWALYLAVENHKPVIVVQRPGSDTFNQELHTLYCKFEPISTTTAFSGNDRSPIKLIEDL